MQSEQRILAIDYGEKRVGVAITDPLCIFATGLPTLQSNDNLLIHIKNILAQYKVIQIIIGLPLSLKGERGEVAKLVEKFAEQLKLITDVEIVLWDERYTSSLASQTILNLGVNKKKRRDKGKIDELAAVHLLQNYLAYQSLNQDKFIDQ